MDEGAVIAAIFTALHADTTLRGATYLNKSGFPWGIYRHNFQPDEPPFPIVTVEWLGGPTSRPSSWEDNQALVTIRVYHGNPAKVHAHLEKVLNQRTQAISASGAEIRTIQRTSKGSDLWDDDYQVHFRPDTYLVRYRLYGAINTNANS